jgi:hypothetical protein
VYAPASQIALDCRNDALDPLPMTSEGVNENETLSQFNYGTITASFGNIHPFGFEPANHQNHPVRLIR